MNKFSIDDTVVVRNVAHLEQYSGQVGSIINIFLDRPSGKHFQQFPDGIVYAVEFESGEAIDVHESDLMFADYSVDSDPKIRNE